MSDATTWTLPVTEEARLALEGQSLPEQITLWFGREATIRELRPIEALLADAKADPSVSEKATLEAAVLIIRRRAEPAISAEVANEVAQDLTEGDVVELIYAFKTGRRDTEGKLRAALRQTLSGTIATLLSALAAGHSLSSSGSTS